ncbi:unnamed protein product [Callosobruchus maculatus]|uniref:Uncharacterized protein n=1 Tax=Callosobruchus maculatus TaxID=64391 RepID=A0A653D1J9_CALMS|nr:unnamed protein product [Callosobruchus maculatus]
MPSSWKYSPIFRYHLYGIKIYHCLVVGLFLAPESYSIAILKTTIASDKGETSVSCNST